MSRRVLIVEDDHGIQTLLEAVLRRHGIESASAGDGDGALKLIAEEDFGAILLDLLLPHVNGFDVLKQMNGSHDGHGLLSRVIVITAASESTIRESEELAMIRCVLRKPLDIDELMSHVTACLDGQSSPQQAQRGEGDGERFLRSRSR